MVTESYDLVPVGNLKKASPNPIELVAVAVLVLAVIVSLVLAILVLVKVNDNSSSSPSTPAPGVSNNINGAPQISSNDAKYTAFENAAQFFLQAINTQADPCTDFYAYACGAWVDANGTMSFDVVEDNNDQQQIKQILAGGYDGPQVAKPLQQTLWYFNTCVKEDAMFNHDYGNGAVITNLLNAMKTLTGLSFPLLSNQDQQVAWPTPTQLGKALGYLSGQVGVNTLLSFFIDTDWKTPYNDTSAYRLFIDQASLFYDGSYYKNGTWQGFQDDYINYITSQMQLYANDTNTAIDSERLKKDVNDIMQLELTVSNVMNTDDTTRRVSLRNYNLYSVTAAQQTWPFMDWAAYLQQLSFFAPANVQTIVNNPTFTVSVAETDYMNKLASALKENNAYGFSARQVINYLMWRMIDSQSFFLPNGQLKAARQLTSPQKRHIIMREPLNRKRVAEGGYDTNQEFCLQQTQNLLTYANARIFVDALYGDEKGKQIKKSVGDLIDTILFGFRSMVDQLSWMSPASKQGAYNKIDNLVKNIAFPDFVLDDAALSQYYAALSINQADTFLIMTNKLNQFITNTAFSYLSVSNSIKRDDWNGPPGIVNAWYQPQLNSITFPAGILQQPFFDVNFPVSVNYGGLGVVAGHELTHGFDDEGVQWDGIGQLNDWMDNATAQGFGRMANCVINEYNCFCPLQNSQLKPSCLNGQNTQGENIADNGGIHAAWRAYKIYQALNGPDPQLSGPLVSQYTHDQLFFLSFARVWCRQARTDVQFRRQILTDPHAPAMYRVSGTVKNFPAFQTAFNCPTGSLQAQGPGKHCNVWVGDNSPSPIPC